MNVQYGLRLLMLIVLAICIVAAVAAPFVHTWLEDIELVGVEITTSVWGALVLFIAVFVSGVVYVVHRRRTKTRNR